MKLLDLPYSQGEFARRCGIPQSRVSEYSMGRKEIPAHHVLVMCAVLRCNPWDIIGTVNESDIDVEAII